MCLLTCTFLNNFLNPINKRRYDLKQTGYALVYSHKENENLISHLLRNTVDVQGAVLVNGQIWLMEIEMSTYPLETSKGQV